MDIANTFRRAWEITWKNKGLWVLGILANCSGSGSQGSGNSGSNIQYRIGEGDFPQFERWLQNIPEETWVTIGIIAIIAILVLALLFLALSAIGNGGLIAGFQMAETGEAVTLAKAFRQGIRHFWKLLVIQLILGLSVLVTVIAVVLGGIVFSVLTVGIGLICLIPLICLLIPLSILLSIYSLLVQIALIVEGLDFNAAFKRAWEITRSNPGEIIVIGLILGIGGFIAGVILTAPFILMALPLILGWTGIADVTLTSAITSTLIGILIYLPVMLVVSGIVRTFTTGSWTLTYRSLMVKESV